MPGDLSTFPNQIWDGYTRNPERAKKNDGTFSRHTESDPDYHDWDRVRDELISVQEFVVAIPVAGLTTFHVSTNISVPALSQERLYLVDSSAGDVVLTFPDPSLQLSIPIGVKKISPDANVVRVLPNGAELIEGDALLEINFQWSSVRMIGDGSNWYIT